jgi:hypothetical protein
MTANSAFADEPRMHYTRHSVRNLLAAYRRAARRMSRTVGTSLTDEAEGAIVSPDPSATVGARFVLARRELRELVSSLADELRDRYVDREDRGEIARYHNLYVLFTWLYQSMGTSMRAITSPRALYSAWIRQTGHVPPLRASLSDKDSDHDDKARLALIIPDLAKQFAHFRLHEKYVGSKRGVWLQWKTTGRKHRPFFILTDDLTIKPLTPGWLAGALHDYTGYPIPANFHRAYLRTELLDRGCPAEIIDAYLGHFNQGESPFSTYSTFDFQHYCARIQHFLKDIHEDLGLTPVASRLVPYPMRVAAR